MRPAARRVESQAAVSPPEVHLKPVYEARRLAETRPRLGRVDRDGYAWNNGGRDGGMAGGNGGAGG